MKKLRNLSAGFTLIELLVVIAIVFILGAMIVGGIGGCSRSNGSRVGQVQKFSHKGNVHDSWEGEMVMMGLVNNTANGSGGFAANVWKFSVQDGNQQLIDDLRRAMRSGKRVELTYMQVTWNNPTRFDTPYRVLKVDFLDDNGNVIPRERLEAGGQ